VLRLVAVFAGLVLLWFGGRRLLARCEAAHVADWGNRWLNRLDGLNRLFCRHFHRLGRADIPLPARGPVLVVSNHVSGLDPLVLIAASRRPLRFLIAREQYERRWLTWLFRAIGCIPVERSRNPHKAFYAARRALEAGEVVALFPYGRILLDGQPSVPLKRGVALLARETGAPIVAVRLDGVHGAGRTVSAVWRRSHVRLRPHAPLHPAGEETDALLAHIARLLAPPHADEQG